MRNDDFSFHWRIVRALIFALGIRFAMPTNHAIPLFDFGSRITAHALLTLATMLFMVWLVFTHFRKSNYIVLFLIQIGFWILNYSAIGPFYPHICLLTIFGYFAETRSDLDRRQIGVFFVSAMYLAAGLFKINSSFLAGYEFLPGGDFFFFLHQNPKLSEFVMQSGVAQILPYISIFTELAISVGILFYTKITIHLSLLFVLVLVPFHPAVIHVYFCMLPFLVIIDTQLCSAVKGHPVATVFTSVFFWYPLILITQQIAATDYVLAINILVFGLLIAHTAWIVFFLVREGRSKRISAFVGFQPIWISMAAIIAVTAVLRASGTINAPLGYSMFAAIVDRGPVHRIRLRSRAECRKSGNLFYFNLTSAAKFDRFGAIDPNFCFLSFPSAHGMDDIKDEICRVIPDSTWGYQAKGQSNWIEQSCVDRS